MARQSPILVAACLLACLLWLDAPGFERPAVQVAKPGAVSGGVERLPFYGDASEPKGAEEAESAIEVSVLSSSGEAAGGAKLLIVGAGLWPARAIEADERGKARIEGLSPGIYDLRATFGDEVVAAPVTVLLGKDRDERVNVRLVRGRKVTVLVVDGEGERQAPIARAKVVLAEGGLSPFPLEAVTDEKGRASFHPVAPSMATVSASAEGFVARMGVEVKASKLPEPAEIEVALLRGGMLVGEVVDARGRAIEGARLEVVGTDTSGAPISETHETRGFRDAHFIFALEAPRPLLPVGELGVMPGKVPDIPRGPGVIPSSVISQASQENDPWISQGDGSFRIAQASPGNIRLIARHPDFVETLSETVRLQPGGESRVKLVMRAGGALEGRVVDDRGDPVARARVDIVALHGSFAESRVTDDEGRFSLRALPEQLSLTVSRPGLSETASVRQTVRVKESEEATIEIKLPALREPVLVRVKDEWNAPLANAQVAVASLSPQTELRRTRFTNDAGEAEFGDAKGLPLLVEVTLPGRAPVVMELDKAPAEMSVTLARGITATGSVTTRRGHDPLEGAEILLQTKAGARRTRSDASGEFRFDEIAEGSARLLVSRKGYVSVEREIVFRRPRRDEPFEIEAMDLAEGGSVEGEVVDADGKVIAGARVAQGVVPAFLSNGRLPAGVVTTDRRGSFRLDDLPEGEVKIEASGPNQERGRVVAKIVAGRTTDRVRIVLEASDDANASESAAKGGVAITLGERDVDESVHVIVVLVTPGSDAERGGLFPGDRIVSVNGRSVSSMREARTRLNGPLGEDVILSIERDGREQRLRIAREPVSK